MFNYQVAHAVLESTRKCPSTLTWLEKQVGGLSKPSKMPWFSYSIPATKCVVGSALRDIEGSVCQSCYAMKGRYGFTNVQNALERRYEIMSNDYAKWAGHMVALLTARADGAEQWFRWHDSGDLQGREHLEAIIWIAQQLPWIHFWLPTKERKLVDSMMAQLETATNLTVRVSAAMVGQQLHNCMFPSSSVDAYGPAPLHTFKCPAKQQDGKCGDCRECWRETRHNVDYPKH